MEALMNFMVKVGLGSPITRGIFGASLFSIPLVLHTPLAYHKVSEGIYIPKQFRLTASADTPPEHTTYIPWFLFPILGAVIFGLFL